MGRRSNVDGVDLRILNQVSSLAVPFGNLVAKGIVLRFGGISPHDGNELAVWDGIHRRCGLEFADFSHTNYSPSD
jgi:hypothetical protein